MIFNKISKIIYLVIISFVIHSVRVKAQTTTDSLQLRGGGNFLRLYSDPATTAYGIQFPAAIPSSTNQILQVSSISGTRAVTTWVTPTGGTVTQVTSGILSPLFTTSVATNTTTPAISYTLTSAGAYTVFGNNTGSNAAPAYFSSGNLAIAGDVTGILGASTVVKLQGTAVSSTVPTATNNILVYNTTTGWTPTAANSALTTGNLTTTTTGLTLSGNTGAVLGSGTTVNYNLGTGIVGLTAGALGVLGGSGSANTYVGADGQTHLLPVMPSISTLTDVNLGTLSNGQILQYSSTSSKWVNVTPSYLTSAITSLNGLTASVQTFGTIGTSGTAPNWVSATSTHTLNIPMASSGTAVTAGLVSYNDWNTFNSKQNALNGTGYVKQNGTTTSYVSLIPLATDVTGILPIANGGTGVSTAATAGAIVYGATATTLGYTAAGTSGQLLTSAGSGTPTWSTVTNGLTSSGGNIVLGGTLNQATTITTLGSDTLTIGGGALKATGLSTGLATDSLLTISGGGVVRSISLNRVVDNSTIKVNASNQLYAVSTGTVTSIGMTVPSALLTVSPSSISTNGTFNVGLANAGAYTVFGNNTNASGVPAYFTPVLASSLFQNQGTTTTVLHGNGSGAPTWSAVNLATDVMGTLPVANGGTGLANIPAYNLIYGNGTSAVSTLAPGTSTYLLQSNGTGTAPSWVSPSTLVSSVGWLLGGNTNVATSSYLGSATGNDLPLVFKVNGVQAGYLGDANSVTGYATTFGVGATAVYQSTAIGYGATASGANQSVAVGYNATAGTSQYTTSLGATASATGNNATALGFGASAVYQATALGSSASATGNNSTAIGYGASTSQANALILGNSSVSVGIGTSTPNNKLEITQGTSGNSGLRFTNLTSSATPSSNTSSPLGVLSVNSNGDVILVRDSSSGVRLNGILTANGTNTIDNAAYAQAWTWNSLAAGNALALSSIASFTGNLLSLSSTTGTPTGSLLNVTSSSTGAIATGSGIVNFNFAAHTNNGFNITDATATGNALNINATALTSGQAILITGGSALTTGSLIEASAPVSTNTVTYGLLNIANTAASSTGKVATIQANSTSGSGVNVYANGNVGINTTTSTFTTPSNTGSSIPTFGVDGTVNATNYTSPVQILTSGTALSWDLSKGASAKVTLSSATSPTLTLTNAKAGMYGTLVITNYTTAASQLSFATGQTYNRVINGGGGTVYLTATASATDIISFFYDGSIFWWTVGNNYN